MTESNKSDSLLTLGEGIKMIVITGGPCSGKTTGLARLSRLLADRGHKVLVSPESATKLIAAGMIPGELPWEVFQEEILRDTLSQEERIVSVARQYRDKGSKVVILCDRGAMDGEAYVGEKVFSSILARVGCTRRELCDGRYHAVIHLRTAALGAEQFYTLANNTARTETLEEATSLDERTLQAWARHSHPRVIDNSTDFEGKLHRLLADVCAVIGDPVPIEREDKFLIEPFDPVTLPVHWYGSQIVQDYLVSPHKLEERRVRARSSEGSVSYYYTIKRVIGSGERLEEERMISEREYLTLLSLRDPKLKTIRKRRICFFWSGQFFEVDLFEEPINGLVLMEVEKTDRSVWFETPPFITVRTKVTEDNKYSNIGIAMGL